MMFPEVLEQLTVAYNLGFQKAEKDDVEKFKEDLVNTMNSTYRKSKKDNVTVESIKDKEFFKVRFTEALDLVRTRKVFLFQGMYCCHISDTFYIHSCYDTMFYNINDHCDKFVERGYTYRV